MWGGPKQDQDCDAQEGASSIISPVTTLAKITPEVGISLRRKAPIGALEPTLHRLSQIYAQSQHQCWSATLMG